MKKVSEVASELKALGCNEAIAKELLIACGVLEDDIGSEYQVGDIWLDADNKVSRRIKRIKGRDLIHDAYYEGGEFNKDLNLYVSSTRFHTLIWREPK